MPSSIHGNFPVVSQLSSSIDPIGLETKNWQFTLATSASQGYIPAALAPYDGPGVTVTCATPFRVTNVETSNLGGSLTSVSVTAVGARDYASPPGIRIIPGGPLIFGLALTGTSLSTDSVVGGVDTGSGLARGGFVVEVRLITPSMTSEEDAVAATYFRKRMPSAVRGVRLPTPSRSPFFRELFSYVENENIAGGGYDRKIGEIRYLGFVCDEINAQRSGGATVHTLYYREKGYSYTINWSGSTGTPSFAYNFSD